MGDKKNDGGNSEPSLELPSLTLPGLGRKKRRQRDETAPDEPVEEPPTEQLLEEPAPPTPVQESDDTVAEPSGPTGGNRNLSLLTQVPGTVAAVVTGAVTGVIGVLLTYLSMRGCESVRGTSSCGGGAGLSILVAIVVVMILLGMLLLKGWQVSSPGSTSFLAVGLVCVVVLVALLEVIFSGWMLLVIPVVSAAAYSASHWVTTRYES